ncbi:MAG: hypothetical protein H6686_00300 [Fibrobacteria bacterium]|nr:hypothetical protein [Fibrobacteria bacterium]
MRTTLPGLCLTTLLALSGCGEDSTSPPSAERRDIPASLRARCPELPPARSGADLPSTPSGATTGTTLKLVVRIYDTDGLLVAHREAEISTSPLQPSYETRLQWDGRDDSGNKVPRGHYFVFTDQYSPDDTFLGTRSDCIGVVN